MKRRKALLLVLLIFVISERAFCEDDDKSNTNRRAEEDYSAHGGPRVAESKSPSHSGTSGNESKEKPLTTGLHHDIRSDGIRWNVVHGTGTEIEDKRRTRLKRKRKSRSEQTGEEQKSDTADPDDLNESLSPMTVVAICAGVLVLLCIIVASVWKNCKKRCRRKKDPEVGIKFKSMDNFSEMVSETILIEKTAIEHEKQRSKDSLKSNGKEKCTVTDGPTPLPLLTTSANIDTPQKDVSTVIEIPEVSSPDTSFTCSSLSDILSWLSSATATPRSSPSLTSVSSLPLSAEPEIYSASSSQTSITQQSLTLEPEICAHSPPLTSAATSVTPQLEIVTEVPMSTKASVPVSEVSLTVEPDVPQKSEHVTILTSEAKFSSPDLSSTSNPGCTLDEMTTHWSTESTLAPPMDTSTKASPLSHPATSKESSSIEVFSSESSDTTRSVSIKTNDSSSSTESFKAPVAPRDEVIITIEDDDKDNEMYRNEKPITENVINEISGVAKVKKEQEGVKTFVKTVVIDGFDVVCEKESGITTAVEATVIDTPAEVSVDSEGEAKGLESAFVSIPGMMEKDGLSQSVERVVSVSSLNSVVRDELPIAMKIVEVNVSGFANYAAEKNGEHLVIDGAEVKIPGLTNADTKGVSADAKMHNSDVKSKDKSGANGTTKDRETNTATPVDNNNDGKLHVKSWCDDDLTTVLARLWAETRSSEDANNYERLDKGAKGKGKGKNTYQTTEGSGKGLDSEASRKSDANFGERNLMEEDENKDKRQDGEKRSCNEIPSANHVKNPQVGCLCHYSEKCQKKSSGPRFFKLPRKLMSFHSKSSTKHTKTNPKNCAPENDAVPISEACTATKEPPTSPDTISTPVLHWNDFYKNRPRMTSWK